MRAFFAASLVAGLVATVTSCATSDSDTGGFGAYAGSGARGGSAGGAGASVGGSGGVGNSSGSGGAETGGASGGTVGGASGTGGIGNASGSGGSATGGQGGGTGGSTNCTAPVPGGSCDTAPQCGCASGQRCTLITYAGVTGCVPDGTTQPNYACSSGTECVAGTECVGDTCKRFCNTKSDCPGALQDCIQVRDQSDQAIPGFLVCTSGCAPEAPSVTCGPGLGCFPTNDPATTTDCFAVGTGIGPGACNASDPSLCAPGYVCVNDSICMRWCRIGTNDCGAGQCSPFTPPLTIGSTQYGVCP